MAAIVVNKYGVDLYEHTPPRSGSSRPPLLRLCVGTATVAFGSWLRLAGVGSAVSTQGARQRDGVYTRRDGGRERAIA